MENLITLQEMIGLGRTFGIKRANHILEEVITAVSKWSEIAKGLDIPLKEREAINNNLRISHFNR